MLPSGSAGRRILAAIAVVLTGACSNDLPTHASDVDIRAAKGGTSGGTSTGLVVSAAFPGAATRDTTLDVRIVGSGFARGMVARWAIDSVVVPDVVVNSTRFISSTELLANITVRSDARLADYDIVVTSTKGGKPGIGTEIFDIVQEILLESLGGTSVAVDVNESGQIAGWSATPTQSMFTGGDHPVIWEADGTLRDLLPADYRMGRATSINENGDVAGWLVKDTLLVPFVWSAATGVRVLPTLPGETQNGAFAINDAGVVAGWSGRAAVIWENGILRVIHVDPTQWSAAVDVNNLGQVIGFDEVVFNGDVQTAWTWSAGSGFQMLPTLKGNWGYPRQINDLGQIVGSGPSATEDSTAFIHEGGVTRQLTAGTAGTKGAVAISELGHILGPTADGRSLMWERDGTTSIICSPVPPAKGYTSTCSANAVNSKGTAVGSKSDKYGRGATPYKWTQIEF
jgi:uncharacterized membrane protein